MNTPKRILFGAFAVMSTLALGGALQGTVALAANPPAATSDWHGPEGRGPDARGMRGPMEGAFMQVLHRLDLSDSQKQQVHSLVSTARAQWRAQAGPAVADLVALGNPGDPGHAAAVQAAQARAAQRISQLDQLDMQVYAVLTPAQQAKLPEALKGLQARIEAHRPGAARPQ
jgi:Spy/CpxP family protein refolding chaperone